jgi:hypothetical protein
MISNLDLISRRRSRLIAAIDQERVALRSTSASIQQDLVYASLGLMIGKLSANHVWFRGILIATLALVAGNRVIKKYTPRKM